MKKILGYPGWMNVILSRNFDRLFEVALNKELMMADIIGEHGGIKYVSGIGGLSPRVSSLQIKSFKLTMHMHLHATSLQINHFRSHFKSLTLTSLHLLPALSLISSCQTYTRCLNNKTNILVVKNSF
jgi:hypothetical protein